MLNILPEQDVRAKLDNCIKQVEKLFGSRIGGDTKETHDQYILDAIGLVIEEELKTRIQAFIKASLCDIRHESLVYLASLIDDYNLNGGQPNEQRTTSSEPIIHISTTESGPVEFVEPRDNFGRSNKRRKSSKAKQV